MFFSSFRVFAQFAVVHDSIFVCYPTWEFMLLNPICSSWLAWFPLLFYTTMYIGDLHKRAFYANLGPNSPKPSEADLATLNAEATRLGSRALFYSSIVTLAGNLLLPFFISKRLASEPFDNLRPTRPSTPAAWHIPNFLRLSLASLWAVGQAVYTACMLGTL